MLYCKYLKISLTVVGLYLVRSPSNSVELVNPLFKKKYQYRGYFQNLKLVYFFIRKHKVCVAIPLI